MRNFNFKKLLPHLIAIAIFLVVTVIFCKPGLEHDVVLKQSDVTGWEGMSHQSLLYKEQHSHFPLWAVSMFSGMPAYQIYMEGAWSPLGIVHNACQLWLPKPLNFFFLACISFYFLCLCMRIKPFASIIGSLGFAYSSFSAIIITAGHDTQMLALAYAPAVIGGVILLFDKKYISGFILTALFTALQIGAGHQQISYYLFLILAAMSIAYIIRFLKNGEVAHLAKSLGMIAVAGFLGLAANALVLLTAYDYAKDSKRGGQLVLDNATRKNDVIKDGKTSGLSKDYAFQWSYGKAETFSLMFPGVNGYGSHMAQRDDEQYIFPKLDENSNLAKFFVNKLNVPDEQAANYALQESRDIYWGDQPFTNGPVYLGAIICFMFLFGMFYLDNKHKWWILAVSIFGILLSWGDHFAGFNYFMFDHLPLYNKFRVPTMTLVIPQLLFPVIAALVLNKLSDENDANSWKQFKFGVIATAAAFACVSFFYISSDFSKENKQRTTAFNKLYDSKDASYETKMNAMNQNRDLQPETDNQLYEAMLSNLKGSPDGARTAREMVNALRKDRAAFLLSDMIRSLIFVLIAIAIVALYLKKKINAMILIIGVTLVSAIDQLGFGMKYLNDKSFDSKDKYELSEFPLSPADESILKDPDPNYRVFNTASLEESKTSYYHKSIGGYHPAKLGIYDDLMQYQLNGSPNISVLNMLNAKYVIQQQGNNLVAQKNPGALGNAWFVKAVKFVNGPVEEMKALYEFNPADTAIVDQKFKNLITGITPADSSSTIRQTVFDNDAITYKSSSTASHVAVFSEIYYKDWKAYIDGKPVDYFKANYVLRAMVVPAGSHTIEFKFEPTIYYTGKNIANISSWILALLLVGFIFYSVKNGFKNDDPVAQ
ncbi:MAG: YfhO family protein [Ferruginibacter sp.]